LKTPPSSGAASKAAAKPKTPDAALAEEVVLSVTQDQFFAKHRCANFGDLGDAIKVMLTEYQKNSKQNAHISTIEDMQAFLERYPAFRSSALNVTKHVTLVSELARQTDVCQLLSLSQLEQEVVCSSGSSGEHSSHKTELSQIISSPTIAPTDKYRLVLLFLMRYESFYLVNNSLEFRDLRQMLERGANASQSDIQRLEAILQVTREKSPSAVGGSGHGGRAPNLFTAGGVLATLSKHLVSSIQGVENVYTQHQPLLARILGQLSKDLPRGRTREATAQALPFVPYNGAQNQAQAQAAAEACRPTEIIVFYVGGTTYEEALAVTDFNRGANADGKPGASAGGSDAKAKDAGGGGMGSGTAGIRCFLGGSCIHNSSSFLKELGAM